MRLFENLALAFVRFFGITEPTAAQAKAATVFIISLLLGGLALVVAFFFFALGFVSHG